MNIEELRQQEEQRHNTALQYEQERHNTALQYEQERHAASVENIDIVEALHQVKAAAKKAHINRAKKRNFVPGRRSGKYTGRAARTARE